MNSALSHESAVSIVEVYKIELYDNARHIIQNIFHIRAHRFDTIKHYI